MFIKLILNKSYKHIIRGDLIMDRLKTFLIYTLLVVGFIVLSEFLINVGLNSQYRPINRTDDTEQVQIYQAEATLVNGRIRGIIQNTNTNSDISNKYAKFSFYSERNVLLGKKFIEINNLEDGKVQPIELFFKLENVKEYSVEIVDEKDDTGEIELLPKDLTKPEVMLATALLFLMFW